MVSSNAPTSRHHGAPKHGDALLAGIIRCRRCGRKLTLPASMRRRRTTSSGSTTTPALPTSLAPTLSPIRPVPAEVIWLKNRSIKFRARYRYGLKEIGSLRFRFGGMFAHAPFWLASSLIQSASYPRSASNIVCGSNSPRRTEHGRLSCVSPGVTARWTGRPLVSTTA
jgi:hypothetical protein